MMIRRNETAVKAGRETPRGLGSVVVGPPLEVFAAASYH
jgi:hypothetical protein